MVSNPMFCETFLPTDVAAALLPVSMYFQIDPAESKEHPPNTVDVISTSSLKIGIVEAHVTDTPEHAGNGKVERHWPLACPKCK
jgi:hypothetical protein